MPIRMAVRSKRWVWGAGLMWLLLWIPPGAWMSVCFECCVLPGRCLCDGLITRPEESYRVRCVWRSLRNLMKAWTHYSCRIIEKRFTDRKVPSVFSTPHLPLLITTKYLPQHHILEHFQHKFSHSERPGFTLIRRGVEKPLVRPTSRCCRTESIVSLEIGVCLCAELQVFSCYRDWKEACQATHAISTTSRRELS